MRAGFKAVLDACVLLPMPLADALLRMAETPRLYFSVWTEDILAEVSRNLIKKFGLSENQASRRENAMREAFPEAIVDDYRSLIPMLDNHAKDRHVLAAAAQANFSYEEFLIRLHRAVPRFADYLCKKQQIQLP